MNPKTIPLNNKQQIQDINGPQFAMVDFSLLKNLMQPNPVFLPLYSTIQQAMEIFRTNALNSVLVASENVLDDGLQLYGQIGIKDVFRQIFPGLNRKDLLVLNHILHEPVNKVMTKPHKIIDLSSDIRKDLSILLQDDYQIAGVQQEGKLIGQICNQDLLKLFKLSGQKDDPWDQFIRKDLLATAKVSEVMAKHVLCLSPKDQILKAIEVFTATDTPHIAILDEQGKIKRIVFALDVLEYIFELIDSKELTEFEQKGLILDRMIGSLIEKEFTTISENAGLSEAIVKMIESNVSCFAVADFQKRFYGLLSCTDILAWIQKRL